MSEQITLTHEEQRNGWSIEQVLKYRAQRDAALGRVSGNTVMPWKRPKPAQRFENSQHYDPFTRKPL